MEQGPGEVQAEGGASPLGNVQQPDVGPYVSSEVFVQGIAIAWRHMRSQERKAIRACCRAGRLQHDRMLSKLRLHLEGSNDPYPLLGCQRNVTSPAQLRTFMQAIVGRGASLQSLSLWFKDSCAGQGVAQLLAALEACSSCPLSRLELWGAVPLSAAVAEAVEARCPQLSYLYLNLFNWSSVEPPEEVASEHHHGCVQLLTLCGPRLRELHLLGVSDWQPLSYVALRRCTALVSLQLSANWDSSCKIRTPSDVADGPALQSDVMSTVSQLRVLKSLQLNTLVDGAVSPAALRPHATCMARLSALTGLTRLKLKLLHKYAHDGDSWTRQQQDGEQHGAWVEVREAHRTSLLSALRCMPQLQHLDCPTLWLRPSELPAPLTALTRLALGGLLPPRPGAGPLEVVDGVGCVSPDGALPPQLRELVLHTGASPRALAQLQPPPPLAWLAVESLYFGIADVTPDGRLRPEAVAAVGPTVRLLAARLGRTENDEVFYDSLDVKNDGGAFMLRPHEGSPNGHMEWIQQLRGLDAYQAVIKLSRLVLSAADLCCLGQALPGLEGLALRSCLLPVVALPALRPPMLQLQDLVLDLKYCWVSEPDVLETVLLLLCRPIQGAVQLAGLECINCPAVVDVEELAGSLSQKLEDNFGLRWIRVVVSH